MRLPRVRLSVRRMMIAVGVIGLLISGGREAVRARYRWVCLRNAEVCEEMTGRIERQIVDPTQASVYRSGTPPAYLREQASQLRWFAESWRRAATRPRVSLGKPYPVLVPPSDPVLRRKYGDWFRRRYGDESHS